MLNVVNDDVKKEALRNCLVTVSFECNKDGSNHASNRVVHETPVSGDNVGVRLRLLTPDIVE